MTDTCRCQSKRTYRDGFNAASWMTILIALVLLPSDIGGKAAIVIGIAFAVYRLAQIIEQRIAQ